MRPLLAMILAVLVVLVASVSAPRAGAEGRGATAASISRSFYLAEDNDAIALDTQISRAFAGHGSYSAVNTIYHRVARRHGKWVLAGRDPSKGANLLTSAAGQARASIRSGDEHGLVAARRYLNQAREQLGRDLRG